MYYYGDFAADFKIFKVIFKMKKFQIQFKNRLKCHLAIQSALQPRLTTIAITVIQRPFNGAKHNRCITKLHA